FGCRDDPVPDDVREIRWAEEVVDQLRALIVAERLEEHGGGVDASAGPARAGVEQLGTSEADEQDRRAARLGDVLDQVEKRRLGPVKVVEDCDERLPAREGFESDAGVARLDPGFAKRREGDAFAVGKTTAADDRGVEPARKFAHEPRLAYAGRAQDGEQVARLVRNGVGE